MAILNDKNKYIKLNNRGNCTIYKSLESREKVKNSHTQKQINDKYAKLIESKTLELDQKIEKLNINIKDISNVDQYVKLLRPYNDLYNLYLDINKIIKEQCSYNFDYKRGNKNHNYPIMEKIYSDIQDSIPEIEMTCELPILKSKSTEDSYNKSKELELFGKNITDC